MKKLKSKKGFIAGAMVDFYSYIAFILIIIIFAAMFLFMKGCEGGQNQINADDVLIEKAKVDANYLVLNFLKTEHGDGNIADLIVSSIENNNYDILEQKINSYFNLNYFAPTAKLGDDIYYWKITLAYPDSSRTYGSAYKSFPDQSIYILTHQSVENTDINDLNIQQIANKFLLDKSLLYWQTVYLYEESWTQHYPPLHYYIPDSNGKLIDIWFAHSRINKWGIFGR